MNNNPFIILFLVFFFLNKKLANEEMSLEILSFTRYLPCIGSIHVIKPVLKRRKTSLT